MSEIIYHDRLGSAHTRNLSFLAWNCHSGSFIIRDCEDVYRGMHAVGLLTLFIGMIFLSGLFKDGFPSSGKAKSATFITLGFLVTFGFMAITVSSSNWHLYLHRTNDDNLDSLQQFSR